MHEEIFFKKTKKKSFEKEEEYKLEMQMFEIFKQTTNLFEIHTYIHVYAYVSLFYCLKFLLRMIKCTKGILFIFICNKLLSKSLTTWTMKIIMLTHRKELHGWITQCPAVFCLIRSFTRAFLLPKSFIANRLSVGWNHACSWFFRKFDDGFSDDDGKLGNGSSFGVP